MANGLPLLAASDGKSTNCKAVLVVHPNNPTGSYVKPTEAAELARFCGQHNLAIIADEVFLDYSLHDNAEANLGAPSFVSGHAKDEGAHPSARV